MSEARAIVSDSDKWRERMKDIAAQHPAIRKLATVNVRPEFLDLLLQNEYLAESISKLGPRTGNVTMPGSEARFTEIMQFVTLGLEDEQMRILAGAIAGFAVTISQNMYADVSKAYFGEAGPQTEKDLMWTVGTMLENLGKGLKSGKLARMKGRVDVQSIELIKTLRKHERLHLTYPELRDALEYAGSYFVDGDALRVFVHRAIKRGWLDADCR